MEGWKHPSIKKGYKMKIQEITILVKGETELRYMTRKEFIDFIDNDVMKGDAIEIVEVKY